MNQKIFLKYSFYQIMAKDKLIKVPFEHWRLSWWDWTKFSKKWLKVTCGWRCRANNDFTYPKCIPIPCWEFNFCCFVLHETLMISLWTTIKMPEVICTSEIAILPHQKKKEHSSILSAWLFNKRKERAIRKVPFIKWSVISVFWPFLPPNI